MKKLLSAILSGALPLVTLAHPGHGETEGFSIIHYVVEPAHAVFTWPLIMGAIGVCIFLYRRRKAG